MSDWPEDRIKRLAAERDSLKLELAEAKRILQACRDASDDTEIHALIDTVLWIVPKPDGDHDER